MKFSKSSSRRVAAHRTESSRSQSAAELRPGAVPSGAQRLRQSAVRQEGATLFVGLGNMGRPMAMKCSPGREMFVFDINVETAAASAVEAGATALPNLRSIPRHIRTVILMLPDSTAVESVLGGPGGVLRQLQAGAIVVDMGSSTDPDVTRRLAKDASEMGIAYVDAPVFGTTREAASGDLAIMVGGSDAEVELVTEHLRCLGKNIQHIGPAGTAHAAKSLVSLLTATSLALSAEVMCVAKFLDIPPAAMSQILGSVAGPKSVSATYLTTILSGDFDSKFTLDLMLGDLKAAEKLIDLWAVEAPVAHATLETARAARTILQSSAPDFTELVRYYERANGVLLRDAPVQHPTVGAEDIHGTNDLK